MCPSYLCFKPENHWKTFSPLKNDRSTLPKKIFFSQSISSISIQKNQTSWKLYLWKTIERIREKMAQKIQKDDTYGILGSLFLHQASTQEPLPLLRRLGFVHLLSATGIHFYALISWWNFIFSQLVHRLGFSVRFGFLTSRIFALSLGGILWLLTGARLGMLRAGFVVIFHSLAQVLGFRWRKFSPLILALLGDLSIACYRHLHHQEHFYFQGRWVYALAVGGGLFFHQAFHSTHLGLAIGSWILVAIWEIFHTGMIALATPLINLVSLPLLCLFCYPLFVFLILFDCIGLSPITQIGLHFLAGFLNQCIYWMSAFAILPGNLWLISKSALLVGLCLGGILIGFNFKVKGFCFLLGISLLIKGIFHTLPTPSRIYQIDVGQAESALFIGPSTGLIDTAAFLSLKDLQWLEFFSQFQVQKLNWIAFTHLDHDHSGGLHRLLHLIPTQCLFISKNQLASKKGKALVQQLPPHHPPIFTHPHPSCFPYPTLCLENSKKKDGPNQQMNIFLLPIHQGFYLNLGDIHITKEKEVLQWLTQFPFQFKKKRILKIAHHGSKYSTSFEFLKALQPTEAWISAGHRNPYHHPAPCVLKYLTQLKIPFQRTDQVGMIASYP